MRKNRFGILLLTLLVGACLLLCSCEKEEECPHEWTQTDKVMPTCESGGSISYVCSICGEERVDALFATDHTYSELWSADASFHWYDAICSHEWMMGSKAAHSFGSDNKCTVCGFSRVTKGLTYIGNLDRGTYRVTGTGDALDKDITVAKTHDMILIDAIGSEAFANTPGLNSVTLYENIEYIYDRAFAMSKDLTYVVLTDSIKSIGDEAFDGCESLTTIRFMGTRAEWEQIEKGENWDRGTGNYTVIFLD